MKFAPPRWSKDLDGTVDPTVLAILRARHPMHYFCVELDCVVEERPDGTIWRVELGPRRRVRYLDDRPIRNVGSAGACLIERNRFR